jgi:hypothetical protein
VIVEEFEEINEEFNMVNDSDVKFSRAPQDSHEQQQQELTADQTENETCGEQEITVDGSENYEIEIVSSSRGGGAGGYGAGGGDPTTGQVHVNERHSDGHEQMCKSVNFNRVNNKILIKNNHRRREH